VRGLVHLSESAGPFAYVNQSRAQGDVSAYNSINKVSLRDSSFSKFLMKLNVQGAKVYSNGVDSAWFDLRTQFAGIPGVPSGEKNRILYVQEHYKGWPGRGNGRVI